MDLQKIDLVSGEFKRDPFPTFAGMRTQGPLLLVKLPWIGKAWVTTNYEAAVTILRDKESFVSEPRHAGRRTIAGMQWWVPRTIRRLANNMLQKDEPDHRRLRELVESAFLRQSVEEMRPRIADLADEHLDRFERASAEASADFVEHFARPFPLAVICELLGLPAEDRPKFLRWAAALSTATSVWGIFRGIHGMLKLNRYLKRQFEKCRTQPRPGMISALVAAEQEGDRLSPEELLATAFLLLFAGHETTVHLLSNAVLSLLQHPGQKTALMNDWTLATPAVDEVLRYCSPVQMTKPRYAARDMELFGREFRRGDVFVPLLAAANCDPGRFEEPQSFDITRNPNPHLAFGTGIHICLGLKLARAEAEIALQKLFQRFPDLDLAIPAADIAWSERLGMRAALQLPLAVNGRKQTAQPHAA